jgi:Anp1
MPKNQAKRLKIVVGTNTLTEIQYPAYTNHCQFWFRLGRSYPEIDFLISNPSRMSIDRMRNMTAKVALEVNADYILFLDDDVIVNPNYGLKQLLDCNADIAAGKVCIRGYPFDYMSFQNTKSGGLQVDSKLPKNGIVDRDAIGFSFALIKVSLLKRLQEPYFITGLNHTEDIYFCLKARQVDPKCSIRVNCDCECGHILWPEVMVEGTREAYTKYYREINKLTAAVTKVNGSGAGDRGQEYLDKVRKVSEDAKVEHRMR